VFAIISSVDSQSLIKIEQIREIIHHNCQDNNWPAGLDPHMSWQGAGDYHIETVVQALEGFARSVQPFSIHIGGFGVFSGEEPILYLSILKSQLLNQLHLKLWNLLSPLAQLPNPYFSPDNWIPHISLVYGTPETQKALACAVSDLVTVPINFEILVDHVSLVFDRDGKYGIHSTFTLGV
jgi:2'-5' RNA ligase